MINSILKRNYIKNLAIKMTREWSQLSKKIAASECYDVLCIECPKFSRFLGRCKVPFGSKLRSCICASTEFHMQDAKDKKVLEIGCGENSFLRLCVESIGGRWIGIDPRAGKNDKDSARSIAAQVAHLPFKDNSFDMVAGNQTIEHWEDPLTEITDDRYQEAMREIWRVVKPGGSVYLDAPIHKHGAPEFILGDMNVIKKVFAYNNWDNIKFISWRKKCDPIKEILPTKRETARWPKILKEKYTLALHKQHTYILSFSARKTR